MIKDIKIPYEWIETINNITMAKALNFVFLTLI